MASASPNPYSMHASPKPSYTNIASPRPSPSYSYSGAGIGGASTPTGASGAGSYSPYNPNMYGGGGGGASNDGDGLRRRGGGGGSPYGGHSNGHSSYYNNDDNDKFGGKRSVVKQLDFMFPKVEKEFTVQTKSGGVASIVALTLVVIFSLAEIITWLSQNSAQLEHISVDTALGKRMRVNMNITFPALACDDLHLDAIDVAGDSQIDVDDTLIKRKLHLNGKPLSQQEIDVEMNFHREQQQTKEALLKKELPEEYCGPCYGAQDTDDQCCQTCDEVLLAYTKKRWKTDLLKYTAEQCIREGRDNAEPKRMTKGQGCNLSGYMTVNRVSGNFHIAMGEGIERDGRHIHTFVPEDAPNFNASHIIHQLSFGPEDGTEPLNGVTKIVTEDSGTTGLFQYFIKVVPTTYKGKNVIPKSIVDNDGMALPSIYEKDETIDVQDQVLETNRYFFTERFRPLMTDLLEDHHYESDNAKKAAAATGGTGSHSNAEHHHVQNSVLPGVFFIYEIYPFAVEISKDSVPFTHLLVRLMATIGGVFTVVKWMDTFLYERMTSSSGSGSSSISDSGRRGGRR